MFCSATVWNKLVLDSINAVLSYSKYSKQKEPNWFLWGCCELLLRMMSTIRVDYEYNAFTHAAAGHKYANVFSYQ